jgi:hypothetical protein
VDVANLPVKRAELTVSDDHAALLAARIANGEHPRVLARKLHPNDPVKRRRAYKRLRAMALKDSRIAAYVADDVRLEMLVGLRATVAGLIRGGARGRADASKLILEASGFHNPRVQHQHSGEIKIRLEMPRPAFDEVVDADVVD